MMHKSITIALVSLGLTLGLPAFAENPARPGTVNYVEGAATLNGQPVTGSNVGSTDLNPGEELSTQQGKAEMLLTPGVFLRLDDNSAVKMISPDLTQTQVELEHGRAGIEVDEIHPQNNLDIVDAGVTTQLIKTGYYEFNANQPTAMVFDGKAAVETGDGKYREVKSHHELALVVGPNDRPLAQGEAGRLRHQRGEGRALQLEQPALAVPGRSQQPDRRRVCRRPGLLSRLVLGSRTCADYTFIGCGPFYSPFGWGFYPFGWRQGLVTAVDMVAWVRAATAVYGGRRPPIHGYAAAASMAACRWWRIPRGRWIRWRRTVGNFVGRPRDPTSRPFRAVSSLGGKPSNC